jgi:hypothetical protein
LPKITPDNDDFFPLADSQDGDKIKKIKFLQMIGATGPQ